VTREIVKRFGTLSASKNGSRREVALVSWNGRPAKLDIRTWLADGRAARNGTGKLTLTRKEAELLRNILNALDFGDIPE
jgi:hypothetical protein